MNLKFVQEGVCPILGDTKGPVGPGVRLFVTTTQVGSVGGRRSTTTITSGCQCIGKVCVGRV